MSAPDIPAETITLSSNQLGKEMAGRLNKAIADFRVFHAGYYVRLQHLPCLEILCTKAETTLAELVQMAMSHQCPATLT